jgi:hypothetical protein
MRKKNTNMGKQTVYEAAGGYEGFLKLAWATTTTMSRYHHSVEDVPEGLRIPKWSWNGLVTAKE